MKMNESKALYLTNRNEGRIIYREWKTFTENVFEKRKKGERKNEKN